MSSYLYHGRVLVGIWVSDGDEADVLLKAVEAGLRQMVGDPALLAYRRQLMNMRFRAWLEQWAGWQ